MGRLPPDVFTYKQQRFIDEMAKDPSNATAAAKRAGYSAETAKQQACNMLHNPKMAKKLAEENVDTADRLGITKERIMQELATIAFADLKNVISQDENGNTTVNLAGLRSEVSGALASLKVRSSKRGHEVDVRLNSKQDALVTLARMCGWDSDKLEISGKLSLEQLIERSYTVLEQPEATLIEHTVTDTVTVDDVS